MSKNKKKKKWFKKHISDSYVIKSKQDNYSSRAAFKLLSLEEKYKILGKAKYVLDLGCSPGSWCEVLLKRTNIKKIVGIDKIQCKPLKKVEFHKIDIRETDALNLILSKYNHKFNLVLSDIAPNITGISDVDQGNFYEIASTIEDFCKSRLKLGGTMIMKYFVGSAFDQTLSRLDKNFKKINVFKPESSKKKSNEIYLICMDFDG